jgi:DNA-binding transcriptional LysR family regulator
MKIRDLAYVLGAATAGNFAHAASTLGLSTSTVSRRIGRLEDELGLTLFERGRTGVQLTTGGKAAIVHVRRAIAEFDAVKETGTRIGSTGVRVMKAWHNDLVPLIERGQVDTPAVRALLHELLDPLAQQGVDQLVLASTHFTFLRPIITAEFGDAFGFADSAGTVATDVACLLDQLGLRNSGAGLGSTFYLFTGDIEHGQPWQPY